MAQELPFDSISSNYSVGTVLDGDDFIFNVHWNARDAAWYMDILNPDEDVLYAGVKIVLGAFLGFRSIHEDMPDGVFYAIDTSQSNVDAGYDDLGARIKVLFLTNSDVADV